MDYYNFLDEYDSYNEWNNLQKKQKLDAMKLDTIEFTEDRVNSPSHYTSGKQEAIEIIEDAIKNAPTPGKGLLQGQVLKYMLRVWLKDNPLEDMKKARWYLERLIDSYNES